MMASQQPTILEQLHEELHDLCQPLTTLQCSLELGRMMGTEEALREAVHGGLEQTSRMFDTIARMRQRLAYEAELAEESIPEEYQAVEGNRR